MEIIQNIDWQILLFLQEHTRNPFLDILIPIITCLANFGAIWIIIAIIFIISNKYRIYGFKIALALIIVSVIGSIILKPWIARPRPFTLNDFNLIIPPPTDFSFPSGHTYSSFAAAPVIFMANRKFGIAAFIIAALIAFSRLYLFVHYPSDIIGGIILGVICALFASWCIDKIFKGRKVNI